MGVDTQRSVGALALALALYLALALDGWDVGTVAAAGTLVAAAAARSLAGRGALRLHALDFVFIAFVGWVLAVTVPRALPWTATYQVAVFALLPLAYAATRADAEFAWSGARGALIALAAAVTAVSLVLVGLDEQPNVMLSVRNNQAAFLNLALFLAAVRPARAAPAAWAALTVLLATGVAVTGSRGGFVGLGCGIVAMAMVVPRAQRRSFVAFGAMVAVGFGIAAVITDGWSFGRVGAISDGSDARWRIWLSAMPLLTERPLVGSGLGMTELVWAPVRWWNEGSLGRQLHSDYLQFLLETGFPGALLLAAIPLTSLFAASRNAGTDARVVAGLGAIAAFTVHCIVDYHLQLSLLTLGFGLVLGAFASVLPAGSASLPRRGAFVTMSVIVVIVGLNAARLLVYDALSPVPDDRYARLRTGHVPLRAHYEEPLDDAVRAERIAAAERAQRWAPGDERTTVFRGALLAEGGRVDEARDALDAALAMNPWSADAHYQLARIALANGERADAEAHLRTAVRLRPRMLAAHELLTGMLLADGRVDDAWTQARTGILHARALDRRQRDFIRYAERQAAAAGDHVVLAKIEWLQRSD